MVGSTRRLTHRVAGFSLVPFLVAVLLLGSAWAPSSAPTAADGDAAAAPATPGATLRREGGQVTVAATWRGPAAGPVFVVALDTHAVDLDAIDLARQAVLRTAAGEIAATRWIAPAGGHHRSGELIFPPTTPDGRPVLDGGPIELVVRDVASVPERSFRWQS